jgi:2-polyprenyl-3-methyl-5-hydroxy-6-metoxy-1,4-benzoquinol methylase
MEAPQQGVRIRERCVVCDGNRLRPLQRYSRTNLVRCLDCGLTFAGWRPTEQELAHHYKGYGTAWFDSPVTRRRYEELIDSFEPYRTSNRILDFGCGAGFLLEVAAARGWRCYGVEFGDLALELSRGKRFEVVKAPLAADAFPEAHFDVITAIEVVEHLRDPMPEAETIAHMLRPGGLLYCTTPNFNSASRRLLGPRWWNIGYPEHLSYFTPRTLCRWLGHFGLVPCDVTTTGFSLTVLQKSVAGTVDSSDPRDSADERLRNAIEESRFLRAGKTTANWILGAARAGDTIKARFEHRPHRAGQPQSLVEA